MERVYVRLIVFAPAASVYRALTDEQSLTAWLAEYVDVRLDEGQFAFWGRHTPFGDLPRQRLIDIEDGRRLRFGWELDGMQTSVDLSLWPTSGGDTAVSVAHVPVPYWGFDRASMTDFWGIAVGNLANFSEGRTLAPRPDYSCPSGAEAHAGILIEAPRDEVFSALTDQTAIDRWLPSTSVVEPWVGGRYDFGWDHGPVEVVEYAPSERLAYTWHNEGWPDTLVSWELAALGAHTQVDVRHSGFVPGRPSDGYQLGWQGLLINLQRMLEIGHRWRPSQWRHR